MNYEAASRLPRLGARSDRLSRPGSQKGRSARPGKWAAKNPSLHPQPEAEPQARSYALEPQAQPAPSALRTLALPLEYKY